MEFETTTCWSMVTHGIHGRPVSLSWGCRSSLRTLPRAYRTQCRSPKPAPPTLCSRFMPGCQQRAASSSLPPQKDKPPWKLKERRIMIPCDFCLGKPHSAEKKCLTCEASLCRDHLRKHNSKATQKNHALVALGTAGAQEEKKCPEHAMLLECFCQDDLACVCKACSTTGSHSSHSVVALKDEYDRQMAILSRIMKSMQEYKTATKKTLLQLQKSEDQIKNNKKTLTDQLSRIFQEIKSQVDQKEKQILGDIQSNEKKQLADMAALKKQVADKRDMAAQGLRELQALTEKTDACLFLKDFQLAQERIKKQNFSNDSVEVLTVHLDQSDIQDVRSHTAMYISNLDALMQVVHGKIISQTQWSRTIPAAEFSLDDVICKVFPSPPTPLTRDISGENPGPDVQK
ncbi:tripartite motif-containing protein 29-like [Podarcis muralis]